MWKFLPHYNESILITAVPQISGKCDKTAEEWIGHLRVKATKDKCKEK